MRKLKYYLLIGITGLCLISCGSTPKSENIESQPEAEDAVAEVDDVVDVIEEDTVIDVSDEVEDDEEYIRSTNKLSDEETVTKAEFEGDKAEILQMISELEEIMAREDVDAWLTYIAPDSIRYYSTPANIRKAQKKLPNKAIVLRGIGDYFKYVFIPAREHKTVNEIRYDSKTNVRAGDADKEKNKFSVVYYFVKVNGKWKVHIPTL